MQTKLKQFILYNSIIKFDGIINCSIEICLKIARKWLNCLGYK